MPSPSKSKGNKFERDIRDLLNKAFETQEFARTPNSGAIMGLGNYAKNQNLEEHTKKTLGSDIICPSWFNFSIECKCYGDKPNYAAVLANEDTFLSGWIGEVLFDAINSKRTPILFFKTNRKGTFVVVPSMFLDIIQANDVNFLRYKTDFLIIPVDFFSNYARLFNTTNSMYNSIIHEWLHTSNVVKSMIDNMLKSKDKKKK